MLFVGSDASRSGAPMVLLYLLRWLKKNTDWSLSVIVPAGGAMLDDFRSLAPTVVCEFPSFGPGPVARNARRVLKALGIGAIVRRHRARSALAALPHGEYDLVYCNSAAAIGLVNELGTQRRPVIVHVHELQYVLENHPRIQAAIGLMRKNASHYIACAGAVRDNLTSRHGVPPEDISLVFPCIDASVLTGNTTASQQDVLRDSVGIAHDVFLVGIVGTLEWRKGADLLVPLAIAVRRRAQGRRICFAWMGGASAETLARVKLDIELAGLADDVKLVGPSNRVGDWCHCFNVFALLSREDPFPLAALEAAAAGSPIVCFENAGGIPEFVGADAGISVPFLDIDAFADAIIRIAGDPALQARLGSVASSRARSEFDLSVICPQLRDVMINVARRGLPA